MHCLLFHLQQVLTHPRLAYISCALARVLSPSTVFYNLSRVSPAFALLTLVQALIASGGLLLGSLYIAQGVVDDDLSVGAWVAWVWYWGAVSVFLFLLLEVLMLWSVSLYSHFRQPLVFAEHWRISVLSWLCCRIPFASQILEMILSMVMVGLKYVSVGVLYCP